MLVAFNARSDANAFCRALIANDTKEYGRRKVIQRFDTLSGMPGLCSYKQTDLVDMTKMHMMQHMMQKSTTTYIFADIFRRHFA